jgi:hypothetical protein
MITPGPREVVLITRVEGEAGLVARSAAGSAGPEP